jgi:hypothetical protein
MTANAGTFFFLNIKRKFLIIKLLNKINFLLIQKLKKEKKQEFAIL